MGKYGACIHCNRTDTDDPVVSEVSKTRGFLAKQQSNIGLGMDELYE
jgi:hypothetical protein